MYIYQIKNKINNKCYIGVSTSINKQRMWSHKSKLRHNKHENVYLQRSWNKYGEENFEFNILCSNIKTKEELSKLESQLISEYNTFNLTDGGKCFNHSEETKEQLSKMMKDRIKNDPTVLPRLISQLESITEEQIKKAVKARREKWKRDSEYRNRVIEANKKTWSDLDLRKKQSKTHKKLCENPRYKKDLIERLTNSSPPDAAKKTYDGLISPDGIIYAPITNLRKFCKEHNIKDKNIYLVANGKRKSCRGWTKYNDQQKN